ncbi:hypothetical protein B0T26DRAFT_680015 [Lasiosphaeria miniovina]|uniref:Uncharacterized protein n=1 Tax=Lasiosphaeria miniovina TaxID=1954250 RepID=A0AA40DMJ6_9PEZI|nr:uncharacterized protein B0T26DRAFT_680015 [Lasiosphaeria miniovina]KAK0706312.1 hypothetical protein B0T26DRAFT_680015 [Lasiosphaeria miniovina]
MTPKQPVEEKNGLHNESHTWQLDMSQPIGRVVQEPIRLYGNGVAATDIEPDMEQLAAMAVKKVEVHKARKSFITRIGDVMLGKNFDNKSIRTRIDDASRAAFGSPAPSQEAIHAENASLDITLREVKAIQDLLRKCGRSTEGGIADGLEPAIAAAQHLKGIFKDKKFGPTHKSDFDLFDARFRTEVEDKVADWKELLTQGSQGNSAYAAYTRSMKDADFDTKLKEIFLEHLKGGLTNEMVRGFHVEKVNEETLKDHSHESISLLGFVEMVARIIAQSCDTLDALAREIKTELAGSLSAGYPSVLFICSGKKPADPFAIASSKDMHKPSKLLDQMVERFRTTERQKHLPLKHDEDAVKMSEKAHVLFVEAEAEVAAKMSSDAYKSLSDEKKGDEKESVRTAKLKSFHDAHARSIFNRHCETGLALSVPGFTPLARCPRCMFVSNYGATAEGAREEKANLRKDKWGKWNEGMACAETIVPFYCGRGGHGGAVAT